MALAVRSLGWEPGGRIPVAFTADGPDRSPKIQFTDVPPGVKSFALVFDDPDAPGGTWVHWVLYDIPGATRELPEGLPRTDVLPDGARQGRNSWNEVGYQGPSPPAGKPHRYILHLYALSGTTASSPGLTALTLQEAIRSRIVATATYLGTYGRPK